MEFIDFIRKFSKMEIEDHGFDVSLSIYEVVNINDDFDVIMRFLNKDDAERFANQNSNEEFHLHVHKKLVWFDE